jgi:Bacterial TSP3 repeat
MGSRVPAARDSGSSAAGPAPSRAPIVDGGSPDPVPGGDPNVIPQRAPLPDLTSAIDVDSFRPGDQAARAPLFPAPGAAPHHMVVIGDGTQLLPPPCAMPVQLGRKPHATIAIDGDLGDWRGVAPSVVDREGDGVTSSTGAKIDLVRVYHTSDDDNHYFAFVTRDNWPQGDTLAYILLRQEQLVLPASDTSRPAYTLVQQLLVQPTAVFMAPDSRVTALPAQQFSVAARGRVIELRLARAELDVRPRSKTWVLDVSINGGRTDQLPDRAGDLVFGVATDSGCLVTLPGRRWKLFVLRRADDVDPEEAEIVYRGAINSAPYVESETGATFDMADTVNVTVVRTMAVAGVQRGTSGMTISLATSSLLGLPAAPIDYFETTAHEYAHGINAVDWQVPRLWIAEGHSEQSARRAVRAAFNASIGQWRYRAHLYTLVADERQGGVAGLEPEPWQAPGKTGSYFYAKAEALVDLLSTLVPYRALNRVWGRRELGGGKYPSGMAVLQAITRQPGFAAPISATMWNGWFAGAYETSVLKRSLIETDSDGDGLLDYQERALGLLPESADSDGDGRSDLFELAAGTDPLTPEPLTGLVVDNLLTDWDRLAPSLLRPAVTTQLSSPGCARLPRLTRYGVLFDGEWLVVAAELASRIADPSFQLLADVREPSGRRVTIAAQTEPPLVVAVDNGQMLRASPVAAPLTGTRQIEMAYHRSWLGWGSTMPPGVTVQIGTAAATRDLASGCEASKEHLLPSRAVP